MILTTILGAIAYNQKNSGEKVHGIASAHGERRLSQARPLGSPKCQSRSNSNQASMTGLSSQ